MKTLLMVIGLGLLAGCDKGLDAQIEKCVQAGMNTIQTTDQQTKNEREFQIRAYCLEKGSGSRN